MKAPPKQPYMPFYIGDWKKSADVHMLSRHDRMVWFEMLMLMHDSEERGVLVMAGAPLSSEEIAALINLDNQIFATTLEQIKKRGVCSTREDGAIYCRSMVRRAELSAKRIISGSLGGNPKLVNQKSKQDTYPTRDIDIVSDNETDLKKEGLLKFRDFVWMSELESEDWKMKLGTQGFERACELANGWVGEAKGTPDFSKRRARAKNATFLFQNWVARAVHNESERFRSSGKKDTRTATEIWLEMEGKNGNKK